VTILGLGPIWISDNEAVKTRTAELLADGGIFGFGLSERTHGADIYSTEMRLVPQADGSYLASGRKYYIGNGNQAARVSTIGKILAPGDVEADRYERFVFFTVDPSHPRYRCIQNVVNSQSYVAEFELDDYPVQAADLLATGRDAWDMGLNTVNIGKYNLGWASIGMCTHALYEAINHASHRVLYGNHVTDFLHVKQLFVDAYCRLVAMKVFALRTSDYIRSASSEDRRYLLYTPMVKMKVTTQGEAVINHLWDVIAAKGFEKDGFFEMSARDIRALPKLEGTVHVNMALIIKFMRNYFFLPGEFPEIGHLDGTESDDFLFEQGPTKGLGNIQFHDYNLAYDTCDLPNVEVLKQQIAQLKVFLMTSASDPTSAAEQAKDIGFLLSLGELFTTVAYGQLILEYRNLHPGDISDDELEMIFDVLVRDFSGYALDVYTKHNSTQPQMDSCLKMIRKPVTSREVYDRVWQQVYALRDQYVMND
jgi:acyl-CoA dehydrogenase